MPEHVAVIGLGLIGGSVAAAARQSGRTVSGFDVLAAHSRRAIELSLIDTAESGLDQALSRADVIVLAVPVGVIVNLLPEVDCVAPSTAVVLDTGSVKAPIVDVMARLPGAHRFVGGHPLAGKAVSGPEAADPTLFRDRPFVLCPSPHTDAAALERATRFVEGIGARCLVLGAEAHDAVVARTSHLPQVLSTVLAALLEPGDGRLAGSGLRDMTRLAASNPIMWRDILLANGQNVAQAARLFGKRLHGLADSIEAGDGETIEAAIQAGQTAAARLDAGAAS